MDPIPPSRGGCAPRGSSSLPQWISSKAAGSSSTRDFASSTPAKTWNFVPPSGTVAKILPFTRNDDFSKCGSSVVSGSDRQKLTSRVEAHGPRVRRWTEVGRSDQFSPWTPRWADLVRSGHSGPGSDGRWCRWRRRAASDPRRSTSIGSALVQRAQLVAAAPDRCTGGPVTTIVFDADDFHDVADRLGSDAADRVLIDLADRLQARLCGCGVTTHLSHNTLGIDCVGLTAEDRVDRTSSSPSPSPWSSPAASSRSAPAKAPANLRDRGHGSVARASQVGMTRGSAGVAALRDEPVREG